MMWIIRMGFLSLILWGAFARGAAHRVVTLAYIGDKPNAMFDPLDYVRALDSAVEFAVESRQKNFLKKGVEIRLKVLRSLGVGLESYRATQQALESKAVAAVGLPSSDDAQLAAPLATKSGFLVITPTATSTELLKHYPYISMLLAPNTEAAGHLEAFVQQRYPGKRISTVVAWDSPFSKDYYSSLSESFRAKSPLFRTLDKPIDLPALVTDILASKPDVIVAPCFSALLGNLIAELSRRGFRGVIIGPDSWGEGEDRRFDMLVQGLPFLGFAIHQYSRLHLTSSQSEFLDAMSKRSKATAPAIALLYYDAVQYLLDLVEEALPSVSRKKILELSRKKRSFVGIGGYHCISSSACPKRKFVVLRVDPKGSHFESEL